MFLNAQGVNNINPGNTGGAVPCGEFTVTFTQALHSSGTTKEGQSVYLGNPNGMIINHPQAPLMYHMGDTDVFGDMAPIEELYHPQIGMIPIGDRFTVSATTAAFAVKRFFNFDVGIPIHYATFDLFGAKCRRICCRHGRSQDQRFGAEDWRTNVPLGLSFD